MSQVNITATDNEINVQVGELRYYGSFFSELDQANGGSSAQNIATCNGTALSNGVTVVSDSQFTMQNAGIYTIVAFMQFEKSDGGDDAVQIWLRKNGSNLANSTVEMTLHGQNATNHTSMTWMVNAAAGDYYQIAWHSIDTTVFLNAMPAGTSPTRPATPSVAVTINRVG